MRTADIAILIGIIGLLFGGAHRVYFAYVAIGACLISLAGEVRFWAARTASNILTQIAAFLLFCMLLSPIMWPATFLGNAVLASVVGGIYFGIIGGCLAGIFYLLLFELN